LLRLPIRQAFSGGFLTRVALHFATRKTLDDNCAEANECTESAVADQFLRKMAEFKIHDARARIAGRWLRSEDR
jgi:hypothetical protein